MVLDGVEDPHNVGAILRTVDAAGGDGVVRQSRRAAPLDAAAAKASAGAVAWVRVAEVVNIARALEELKALNVWTVGLAGDAPQTYDTVDLTLPTAIVLGAEGTGLRRLVRERCDLTVSIPMAGHVESLNVSVAAGVVLFEAVQAEENRRARGSARFAENCEVSKMGGSSRVRERRDEGGHVNGCTGVGSLAQDVLDFTLCPAGVAQPGRAADL